MIGSSYSIVRESHDCHMIMHTCTLADAAKQYGAFVQKSAKLWGPYLDCVMKVGQIQLIRCQIANQLNRNSKFDSRVLVNALQTFNQ